MVAKPVETLMSESRIWRYAGQAEGRVRLGVAEPAAAAEQPSDTCESLYDLRRDLESRGACVRELEARLAALKTQHDEKQEALEQLRKDLSAAREAAQREGFKAGLEKGEAQYQQEFERQMAALRQMLQQMAEGADQRWRERESELTEVVLAAVAKVMGDQMAHPQTIRSSIEQAMKESAVASPLRVLIAPGHYDQLMKGAHAQLTALRDRRIEIAPDQRVAFGGCLLETHNGAIDARFEVQLQRLREIVSGHYVGTNAIR